jgi:K+ transporter
MSSCPFLIKRANLRFYSYQSTGTIYGDIGTSPLYVYSSTFTSRKSEVTFTATLFRLIQELLLLDAVLRVNRQISVRATANLRSPI